MKIVNGKQKIMKLNISGDVEICMNRQSHLGRLFWKGNKHIHFGAITRQKIMNTGTSNMLKVELNCIYIYMDNRNHRVSPWYLILNSVY